MKSAPVSIAVAVALLSGCASLPSVSYKYHMTKWETTVTVTQTLGCATDGKTLVDVGEPTVDTRYFADTDTNHDGTINLDDVNSKAADSNFKIDYMSDGRLQGINSVTTGQGGAIFKAAISAAATLASSLYALPIVTPAVIGRAPPPTPTLKAKQSVCQKVANLGKDKPITIVYQYQLDAKKLGDTFPVTLSPNAPYEPLHTELTSDVEGSIPSYQLTLGPTTEDSAVGTWKESPDQKELSPQRLKVQRMAFVTLTIQRIGGHVNEPAKTATVLFPKAETYELPIPKARPFGSQTFVVAMDDSGRVKSSGYQHTGGAAGVIDAIQEAADTQTASSKAASLRAQADLIVQQQRVVTCMSHPTDCK